MKKLSVLLFVVFRSIALNKRNYITLKINVNLFLQFFLEFLQHCMSCYCGDQNLAEGVGFEPTDTFVSPVFKTGAFGRSATPPLFIYFLLIENNILLPNWSSKNYYRVIFSSPPIYGRRTLGITTLPSFC